MEVESDAQTAETTEPNEKPQRKGSFLRELAIIVVSALVLSWVIKSFFIQAFFIPSASMEDTFSDGDRILVSKLVPGVFDVHRGDVVVFKDPGDWLASMPESKQTGISKGVTNVLTFVGLLPQDSGEHLVKRVIGVPGDTVACCTSDGKVTVNGQPIDEQYLKPGSAPSLLTFNQVVPKDSLWVMGDNRAHSSDSRYNGDKPYGGFVPLDNVVGTAFVKVWPLGDMGWLRNPGDVFRDVPEP